MANINLNRCYNTGNISSKADDLYTGTGSVCYAGGVFGLVQCDSDDNANLNIRNCYNVGNISSSATAFPEYNPAKSSAGGICAEPRSVADEPTVAISNCYNTGSITSVSQANNLPYAGGICVDIDYTYHPIPYHPDKVINNCYCLDLYGSEYGTRLTTEQMKLAVNFVGFDFDKVWEMSIDGGYPILQERDVDNGEYDQGQSLRIISFDWINPEHMIDKGKTITNGIITYNYDTYVYAHMLYMTVSDGAEWNLYGDKECTVPIDKTSTQYYTQLGVPYLLYIKLTKSEEPNVVYGLRISRRDIPSDDESGITDIIATFTDDGRDVDIGFEWGLDYFKNTSFEYRHELAIAALILSAQAENNSDKTETALSQLKLWDENSENIDSEHYSEVGIDFGVARTIALKKYGGLNIITIVARGTITLENVITDVTPWGFESAAGGICNDVRDFLSNKGISIDDNNNRFFVVGHSLGGAAANLLANKLVENGAGETAVYGYTFASPFTVFPLSHERNYIFNVINKADLVTFVSPMGPFTGARFGVDIPYFSKSQRFRDAYYKLTETQWPEFPYFLEHATRTYMAYLMASENISYSVGDKRLIRIHCPVDVEVSDLSGVIVAAVVNNSVTISSDPEVQIYVFGESKYLLLPADTNYLVKLTGYDTGVMNYLVQDIAHDGGKSMSVVSEKLFSGVQLYDGKQMTNLAENNILAENAKLFVVDDDNQSVAEVQSDGTETPVSDDGGGNDSGDETNDDGVNGGGNNNGGGNTNPGDGSPVVGAPSGGGGGGGAPAPVASNASVTPAKAEFGKNGDKDVAVNLTLSGRTLTNLKNGATVLKRGVDYNVSGSAVTIKAAYLSKLPAGTCKITFDMNDGSDPLLTITIVNAAEETTDAQPDETAEPEILLTLPGVEPRPRAFLDVPRRHWAYEYIRELAKNAIVDGYPAADGGFTFQPENGITRAEIVKLIVASLALPLEDDFDGSAFADWAAVEDWAKPYVGSAVTAGIVNGSIETGGLMINASADITRQEMIAMAARALGIAESSEAPAPAGITDFETADEWARPALAFALEASMINTDGGLARPLGNATRAEAAMMLYKMLEYKFMPAFFKI